MGANITYSDGPKSKILGYWGTIVRGGLGLLGEKYLGIPHPILAELSREPLERGW